MEHQITLSKSEPQHLAPSKPQSETASSTLAAQARAVIEARYLMAERHPRDLDVVREKLLKECKRPGFAQVARYLKPVGKGVEGFSIRFAEAAIRFMQNVSVEQMTLYDDREKRIVRVTVADCETNTAYFSDITVEKTVERRSAKEMDEVIRTRQNKNGDMLFIIAATEEDLLNKQNALVSKSIRTNGLRLIPGDILEECREQVIDTQKKLDAQDPDSARRKIFDVFATVGVTVEALKAYLGHDATILTQKELLDLRAHYAAIRDGESTWREIMEAKFPTPIKAEGKGVAAVKEKLKTKKADEIWPKREEPADEQKEKDSTEG